MQEKITQNTEIDYYENYELGLTHQSVLMKKQN